MTPPVRSFPPILAPAARVLVLGSMPGERSLAAGQYYAHPRNTFWRIVGACCGFPPELPYDERTRRCSARGVAVWDVLQCCVREGSLDAAIVRESMQPNDFAGLFAAQPGLRTVLCNGGTAFTLFRRLVLPGLGATAATLQCRQLPSTSPAHASLGYAEKLAVWREALVPLLA